MARRDDRGELARLSDLPIRKPSPTLAAVGANYQEHAKVKPRELSLSKTWSAEFWKVVKVSTLRQLNTELMATYYDHVMAEQ